MITIEKLLVGQFPYLETSGFLLMESCLLVTEKQGGL